MTHAEAVKDAERAVVEAAVASGPGYGEYALAHAIDALRRARAETCPTCGGKGKAASGTYTNGYAYGKCPAGCDQGKRRDG